MPTYQEVVTDLVYRSIVPGWPAAVGFDLNNERYLWKVCGRDTLHYALNLPPRHKRQYVDLQKIRSSGS